MTDPITVWLTPPGPNSWKVVVILEELKVPYKIHSFKYEDVKKPPFINVNPNGRVPAIEDPNTKLTLWETGAIIQYLIEQYDTEKKLTTANFNDRQLLNQWLMFQVSGQGPYYGQLGWFSHLHSEKFPSAIERYTNEAKRVLSVLEGALEGKTWLVGDKCTFADLAFMPWNARLDALLRTPSDQDPLADFPNVQRWHQAMISRDSWKTAMQLRDAKMDEQGLQPNGMPKGVNTMKEYEEWMAAQVAKG